MTLIESVRAWLKTYPQLAEGWLGVDFLPPDKKAYSVEVVPCTEMIKTYINGDSVRQLEFVLASCEYYADDIAQNTSNLEFYEAFALWVDTQNRKRLLPILADGRKASKIEVTTSGYPFYINEHGTARYQYN